MEVCDTLILHEHVPVTLRMSGFANVRDSSTCTIDTARKCFKTAFLVRPAPLLSRYRHQSHDKKICVYLMETKAVLASAVSATSYFTLVVSTDMAEG